MIIAGSSAPRIVICGEALGEIEDRYKSPFLGVSGAELLMQLRDADFLPPGSIGSLTAMMYEAIDAFRQQWFSRADALYRDQIIPLRDGIMQANGIALINVIDEHPPFNDIEKFFYSSKKKATEARVSLFMGRYAASNMVRAIEERSIYIRSVKPELILCMGGTAQWAMTGKIGIMKWRGSELPCQFNQSTLCVPTWHPAAVLREWSMRYIAVHDLRRAKRVQPLGVRTPEWKFTVRPVMAQVLNFLQSVLASQTPFLVSDLETRGGHIACCGIALSKHEAISIPFMCVERPEGYWSLDEEHAIILALRACMTQKKWVFQNAAYDCQYFAKEWGYVPNVLHDTMIAQHVLWALLRKALDFQASMYCDQYCYWKDDGKTWDPKMPEDQLWRYNCEDCVRTFECCEVELGLLEQMGLTEQYHFQMEVFHSVLRMMLRGIELDHVHKARLVRDLGNEMQEMLLWFEKILGHSINPRSFPQMATLFLEDFGCKPVLHRKTKRPTFEDDALQSLANKTPLIRPLCRGIAHYRSLGVQKSTFAEAEASIDNKMRTSYNMTGAHTYRFSSSEDAFGSGMNLQNIPRVEE